MTFSESSPHFLHLQKNAPFLIEIRSRTPSDLRIAADPILIHSSEFDPFSQPARHGRYHTLDINLTIPDLGPDRNHFKGHPVSLNPGDDVEFGPHLF